MPDSIQRLKTLLTITGLSRSTIYLRISHGLFTKPTSLGGRAVGWPSNEITSLIAARIAGKTDKEIRDLVSQLEADRKLAK